MVMAFISYKVENDKAFQQSIDKAFKESKDLRIPFRTILRDFYQSRKAIFRLRGPGAYPPFKGKKVKDTWKNPGRPSQRTREGNLTAYENFKKKMVGFTYPLLKLTGTLENSITKPNDSNAKQIVAPDSLTMITTVPYANYHQQDNPNKGNRIIPTRKFFFIGGETSQSNRQLQRYIKIIEDYVVKRAQGGNK